MMSLWSFLAHTDTRYDVPLGLFIVAFAFRAALNDLKAFSPADETSYLRFTKKFSEPGIWSQLPALTQRFVDGDPEATHPFRFAWYAFTALVCRFSRPRNVITYKKLAWVSTLAGSTAPSIAYLLASRHGLPALPAALLVMTAPIHLGLGRRALQDTALGSLTALSFLAAGTGNWLLLLPVLTITLFVKEVSLLGWPGYAAVFLLSSHANGDSIPRTLATSALALGLPPVLFLATSMRLLDLDLPKLRALYVKLTRHEHDAYAMDYGRGPAHTYAVGLALASPLIVIALLRSWHWSALSIGILLHVTAWSVLKFKNYRFFTGAEIVLRTLAAGIFLITPPILTYPLLAAMMTLDLWMFRRLFLQRDVYDPVIHTVEKALDMVP